MTKARKRKARPKEPLLNPPIENWMYYYIYLMEIEAKFGSPNYIPLEMNDGGVTCMLAFRPQAVMGKIPNYLALLNLSTMTNKTEREVLNNAY